MFHDDVHVVHARCAGLDVHKAQVTATMRLCVGSGEPVIETREFSALPSGLDALVAWLESHAVEAAAMEGTGVYWRAPWERLTDAGIRAELFHAQHVKQLKGRKTDIEDSRWLATICQFGLGRPSLVPEGEFRRARGLSRHRRTLVQERSRVRNRVQKVIDGAGVRIGSILSDVFGANGRTILEGLEAGTPREDILAGLTRHVAVKVEALGDALSLELADWERTILGDLMAAEDILNKRIAVVESALIEGLAPHRRALDILQTMPGVDAVAAASILAETGPDMSVFGSAHAFTAWAGLSPGNNESAGKRRSGGTRKGSKHLRAALVEAAHAATRTNHCQFPGYKRAIAARRGHKRALVATAHKMARIIYVMLRDATPYRDPGTDYEALLVNRNAGRWLRQLGRFGILQKDQEGALRVNWHALKSQAA